MTGVSAPYEEPENSDLIIVDGQIEFRAIG